MFNPQKVILYTTVHDGLRGIAPLSVVDRIQESGDKSCTWIHFKGESSLAVRETVREIYGQLMVQK